MSCPTGFTAIHVFSVLILEVITERKLSLLRRLGEISFESLRATLIIFAVKESYPKGQLHELLSLR